MCFAKTQMKIVLCEAHTCADFFNIVTHICLLMDEPSGNKKPPPIRMMVCE